MENRNIDNLVLCVDPGDKSRITMGHIYEIVDRDWKYYVVKTNDGKHGQFYTTRFTLLRDILKNNLP